MVITIAILGTESQVWSEGKIIFISSETPISGQNFFFIFVHWGSFLKVKYYKRTY